MLGCHGHSVYEDSRHRDTHRNDLGAFLAKIGATPKRRVVSNGDDSPHWVATSTVAFAFFMA